jgi:uncharacterized protein YqjF (DUF2071 family)
MIEALLRLGSLRQVYEELLLIHWPVDGRDLRRHLPPGFEPTTFGGTAWIGHDVYLASYSLGWGPRLLRRRPHLTLRTMVSVDGVPGIYLLALDVPDRALAFAARAALDLPCGAAVARMARLGDGVSARFVGPADGTRVRIGFNTGGPRVAAETVSPAFADFIIGADRLFLVDRAGSVFVTEVEHGAWDLREVPTVVHEDSMIERFGIDLQSGRPISLWQPRQTLLMRAPRPLVSGRQAIQPRAKLVSDV